MIRVLGIDPGSRITGYGIIDMQGNHATHIAHGSIRIQGDDLAAKLRYLYRELIRLLDEHRPDEISVEKVFMHKNADSALKLGQARGCAITACAEMDLPVFEYTATQVKQATVGKGHAAKEQVQHMIKVLLCLRSLPEPDAADALAIALCHGHSREGLLRMAGVRGMRGGRLQ
jgi:crossover junction endodeoxyribonuclease RuvC